MWLSDFVLGDGCYYRLDLNLAIVDLVGNWHRDFGLHAGLNLPATDLRDCSMGDLRLTTNSCRFSIIFTFQYQSTWCLLGDLSHLSLRRRSCCNVSHNNGV